MTPNEKEIDFYLSWFNWLMTLIENTFRLCLNSFLRIRLSNKQEECWLSFQLRLAKWVSVEADMEDFFVGGTEDAINNELDSRG